MRLTKRQLRKTIRTVLLEWGQSKAYKAKSEEFAEYTDQMDIALVKAIAQPGDVRDNLDNVPFEEGDLDSIPEELYRSLSDEEYVEDYRRWLKKNGY